MIIGLTGGIGSGKSAAADFIQNEGVTVIDANDLAMSMDVTVESLPSILKDTFIKINKCLCKKNNN